MPKQSLTENTHLYRKFLKFHGNWDLFTFPCKYRSRGPTQTNHQEILISRFHRNGCLRNPDFPFLSKRFRWKCLFSRGFPFSCRTIPRKYRFIKSRAHWNYASKYDSRGINSPVSRMHGTTKREQHVRIHAFVDGRYGIGPVSGLWCIVYISPVFSNFVFRIRTYWFLMSSCCRWGGCCGCAGCIAGFLPKRSRLLDAPIASSKIACCYRWDLEKFTQVIT